MPIRLKLFCNASGKWGTKFGAFVGTKLHSNVFGCSLTVNATYSHFGKSTYARVWWYGREWVLGF